MTKVSNKSDRSKNERVRRSIVLSVEDDAKLIAEAKRLDRSVNWVVNQLVRKDLKTV